MRVDEIALLVCSCIVLGGILSSESKAVGAPQSPRSGSIVGHVPADGEKSARVTFKSGDMGEIEIDHGVRLGFTDYTASDGVWLRVLYLTKLDRIQASEVFDQRIAHAVKVIERSEKKDKSGKVVGERARILAPAAKPAPPYNAIIWTDDATFHEIGSGSLQHVLEFEKEYKY